MKNQKVLAAILVAAPFLGAAQGTFIYDQQSSMIEGFYGYGGGPMQDTPPPWGQSFTPSLDGIDFIRLKMNDVNPDDGGHATVYINLLSGSISGTIIGTTSPLVMPNGFSGNPTFFFPSTVPLTPGTTYYFSPVVEAGSAPWNIVASSYNYSGGSAWANGQPGLQSDLWFREGLYIVPEPSSAALILAGAGVLLFCRRKHTMLP